MSKLKWQGRSTVDDRFRVNSDNVRGEGICYFLACSSDDRRTAQRLDIETAFYGRGGVSKVKAAAQAIADASPVTS